MRFSKTALTGLLSIALLSGCTRGQARPTMPPTGQAPGGNPGYGYVPPTTPQQPGTQPQQPQNDDEYWYALYQWCAENYPGYEEECVYSFYDSGSSTDGDEMNTAGYYAGR